MLTIVALIQVQGRHPSIPDIDPLMLTCLPKRGDSPRHSWIGTRAAVQREPYLATWLQDFWWQRLNLMVSVVQRPAVYHPVRRVSARVLGSRWALPPAILATFLVSGLMHEVIYYYWKIINYQVQSIKPLQFPTLVWLIKLMSTNFSSEIQSLVKIWLTAAASLIFCHQIPARLPGGAARLPSILPIIYLFTVLPTNLSCFHLAGPTIFYLVWLGNFKLLLFAFDQGPLSSNPPLSLIHFISIALLPIKTEASAKQNPPPKSNSNSKKLKNAGIVGLKCLLLAAIISLYRYRDSIHEYVILALYSCHVYLGVELILAVTAAPVRAIFGFEIEPQFNEPYLATSLQDFWGRRWNLMVTSILRPAVYHPVRRVSARVLGSRWAQPPAILATFLVSGLMHEVIYYYLSRASPTWEVTWFFVLHGFCVVVEVAAKKALAGRWRLPRMISGPLTVGFVAVTGGWLFFPQVIRNGVDRRTIEEYFILFRFIGDRLSANSTLKF